MNIGMWIITIIGGASGALSTLYIIVSLIYTIGYKIYRRAVHGIPLYK